MLRERVARSLPGGFMLVVLLLLLLAAGAVGLMIPSLSDRHPQPVVNTGTLYH